jgi:hypothetical protein
VTCSLRLSYPFSDTFCCRLHKLDHASVFTPRASNRICGFGRIQVLLRLTKSSRPFNPSRRRRVVRNRELGIAAAPLSAPLEPFHFFHFFLRPARTANNIVRSSKGRPTGNLPVTPRLSRNFLIDSFKHGFIGTWAQSIGRHFLLSRKSSAKKFCIASEERISVCR